MEVHPNQQLRYNMIEICVDRLAGRNLDFVVVVVAHEETWTNR